MAGVLPRAPLVLREGRIVLDLPEDQAPLAGERLLARLRQLGQLMAREAHIAFVP